VGWPMAMAALSGSALLAAGLCGCASSPQEPKTADEPSEEGNSHVVGKGEEWRSLFSGSQSSPRRRDNEESDEGTERTSRGTPPDGVDRARPFATARPSPDAQREPNCSHEGPDGRCLTPEESSRMTADIEASRTKARAALWSDGAPKAVLTKELQSGRCTDRHVASFQRLLDFMEQAFSNSDSSVGWLNVAQREVFVASGGDTPIVVHNGIAQTMHVFVFQFGPDLALRVVARDGKPATEPSQYEPSLEQDRSKGGYETRQIFVNPYEEFVVRIGGHGCTMVVAMSEGRL
jgi:hypothetical protein